MSKQKSIRRQLLESIRRMGVEGVGNLKMYCRYYEHLFGLRG